MFSSINNEIFNSRLWKNNKKIATCVIRIWKTNSETFSILRYLWYLACVYVQSCHSADYKLYYPGARVHLRGGRLGHGQGGGVQGRPQVSPFFSHHKSVGKENILWYTVRSTKITLKVLSNRTNLGSKLVSFDQSRITVWPLIYFSLFLNETPSREEQNTVPASAHHFAWRATFWSS